MSNDSVMKHINELVEEEHRLRRQLAAGEITAAEEHARLRTVEQQLDQLWDLMRRRQVAQKQGQSPDRVKARPVDEVEGYLQ